MRAEVRHTPQTEQQVIAISEWWRENRTAAPDLFRQELEGAIDLLEQSPDSGRRYPGAGVPGLRRLLLPKTRYHVYYVHDSATALVLILAVWSAVRGRGPDFSGAT